MATPIRVGKNARTVAGASTGAVAGKSTVSTTTTFSATLSVDALNETAVAANVRESLKDFQLAAKASAVIVMKDGSKRKATSFTFFKRLPGGMSAQVNAWIADDEAIRMNPGSTGVLVIDHPELGPGEALFRIASESLRKEAKDGVVKATHVVYEPCCSCRLVAFAGEPAFKCANVVHNTTLEEIKEFYSEAGVILSEEEIKENHEKAKAGVS